MRSDGPDGGKEMFIRQVISHYRDMAKQQLLDEFPEVKAEADRARQRWVSLRMPAM